MSAALAIDATLENERLCGFKIGDGHYAIPVLDVQEVVQRQPLTTVPLAPDYVSGLINLRGQIVTSIDLRELFHLGGETPENYMNIIVRSKDSLFSLVVDDILDVMDTKSDIYEETPDTLDSNIKDYISGVYKQPDNLLVLLNLEKILNV